MSEASEAQIGENEFKCVDCNEVFTKGLTDEEAKTQFGTEFPLEEFDWSLPTICEDCFQKRERQGGEALRMQTILEKN